MSQKVKYLKAKLDGNVYLGFNDETQQNEWTTDPWKVLRYLGDGYRSFFNKRRADLRCKYAYEKDANGKFLRDENNKAIKKLDENGEPVLIPISGADSLPETPETESYRRKNYSYAQSMPPMILRHALMTEKQDWFAASKRRKTLISKGKNGGKMPFFRRRKDNDYRFSFYFNNGGYTYSKVSRLGKKSYMLEITGVNPKDFKGEHALLGKIDKPISNWTLKLFFNSSTPIREYTSVHINPIEQKISFSNAPLPITKNQEKMTGELISFDSNVTNETAVACSDGRMFERPDVKKIDKKIEAKQKSMDRKRKLGKAKLEANEKWIPSQNYLAEQKILNDLYVYKTNLIEDWNHKVSTELVRTCAAIGHEDLKLKNMMKSAKETIENPGKNVKAKSGLNRSLASAKISQLFCFVDYKAKFCETWTPVYSVWPGFTSQKCHKCQYTSKKNRENQAVFVCKKCSWTGNADYNASMNILERALVKWSGDLKSGRGHMSSEKNSALAEQGVVLNKNNTFARIVNPKLSEESIEASAETVEDVAKRSNQPLADGQLNLLANSTV